MELTEAMRTTGAARAFLDAAVPDDVLYRVFDNARFAPSGGNRQGWSVVLVQGQEVRAAVRDAATEGWGEYAAFSGAGLVPFAPAADGRWHGVPPGLDLATLPDERSFLDHLLEAPVLAVLVADLRQLAVLDVDLDRQSIVGGASIYPFAQNVLLAARQEGLGGVLTTFVCRRERRLAPVLGLGPADAIAGMLCLGYPERFPRHLTRRPVEEFVRIDRLDGDALVRE